MSGMLGRPVRMAIVARSGAMARALASASSKPVGVRVDEQVASSPAALGEMDEQAGEQRAVRARLRRGRTQIGILGGGGDGADR